MIFGNRKAEYSRKKLNQGVKRIRSMKNEARHNHQGGFTLIEIMMVVAAIGVLMALLIPNMTGGSSRQDAQLMERVARAANSSYMMINRSCGTSQRITSNNILNSGDSQGVIDLLFFGDFNESDYLRCYERAGVTPQSSDIDASGGGDVRLTGTDIPIAFVDNTGSEPRSFNMEYSNVTRDVAEAVAQRFDSEAEFDNLSGPYPAAAGDRAPLHISGSGDDLTLTFRFLW